jgi:hypothetical protein
MNLFIKKLLREGLFESINLNLSKQIRSKQLSDNIASEVDKNLEEIFGKGVYRLYYDLSTGKQITPTRKQPKLRFDVGTTDELKDNIESLLKRFDYTLVDMDKNIAKNNKNGQTIKITKVLQSTDKIVFKKYNEYLGAMTNSASGNEKLFVVISRHSHDIASMSTKPKITSCESLEGYTDIKQTYIGQDVDEGEGYGLNIWGQIQRDGIIFYLIKEGDWNIQDPISRFLGTGICEFGNAYHFYGNYNNDFKNFVIGWLDHYKSKVLNQYTVKSDKDLFNKDVDELSDIIKKRILKNDKSELTYLIRGLIKNERYDVLYDLMTKIDVNFNDEGYPIRTKNLNSHKIKQLANILNDIFGYKIINQLPDNVKGPIVDYATSIVDGTTSKLKSINNYFRNTDGIKNLYMGYINRYKTDKSGITSFMIDKLKSDLLTDYDTDFVEVGDIGNWVDVDKLNEYKRELKFYKESGGYDTLKSIKRDIFNSIINHFNADKKD